MFALRFQYLVCGCFVFIKLNFDPIPLKNEEEFFFYYDACYSMTW